MERTGEKLSDAQIELMADEIVRLARKPKMYEKDKAQVQLLAAQIALEANRRIMKADSERLRARGVEL